MGGSYLYTPFEGSEIPKKARNQMQWTERTQRRVQGGKRKTQAKEEIGNYNGWSIYEVGTHNKLSNQIDRQWLATN